MASRAHPLPHLSVSVLSRINDVNLRTVLKSDGVTQGIVGQNVPLDVHRITFGDATVTGSDSTVPGNTPRTPSHTIGYALPAGFERFPFRLSYQADGLYLAPELLSTEQLASLAVSILYTPVNQTDPTTGLNQYSEVSTGGSQVYLLFQPTGGFGFTAAPMPYGAIDDGQVKYQGVVHNGDFGVTLPNLGNGQTHRRTHVARALLTAAPGSCHVTHHFSFCLPIFLFLSAANQVPTSWCRRFRRTPRLLPPWPCPSRPWASATESRCNRWAGPCLR